MGLAHTALIESAGECLLRDLLHIVLADQTDIFDRSALIGILVALALSLELSDTSLPCWNRKVFFFTRLYFFLTHISYVIVST